MAYTIGPDGRRYYNGQRDNEEGRHSSGAKTTSRTSSVNTSTYASTARTASTYSGSNYTSSSGSTPWGWIVAVIIIIGILGAFFYNRVHVSEEERAIDSYMEEQMQQDSTTTASAEEYIIWDSDARYLTEDDIYGMTYDEIQMVINEIYARHGFPFQKASNAEYFASCSWYTPVEGKTDEQVRAEFNEFERANVDYLAQLL